MDLETRFFVQAAEPAVKDRIAAYFSQAGYSAVPDRELEFTRGSALSSMASFSPRKWKVNVSVATTPLGADATQVAGQFHVNTTGQWVTDKERAVWDAEVQSFEQSVTTGDVRTDAVQQATSAVAGSTLRAILVFMAVALAVGLPLATIGVLLTGDRSFSNVGIVIGLAAGYLVLQRFFGVGKHQ
jgi:hypothetical protein